MQLPRLKSTRLGDRPELNDVDVAGTEATRRAGERR
jgi:hypothetical protein